ncbi:hypothetical protein VTO42DRAFT_5526 [Malbranchea cinnamomea]
MLSSGFTNAPVTKFALVFMIVGSIAVSIFDVKYLFYIDIATHLWTYWQVWRLFAWQLCYLNSTEVLQAGMVLYTMRVVERLWGSRKFASFIVSTLPYTCLLPPLLLAILVRPLSLNTLNYLPAGPTAILFAVLAQYHAAIPSTYKYHISTSTSAPSSPASSSSALTLRLSDKSTTYFLAFQLSLSQFPYSILPALTGWMVGLAWRAELLPGRISSWRIPGWVYGDPNLDSRARARRRGEQYEGLRRRLESASRAAAAASGASLAGEPQSRSGVDSGRRRPLARQILDQFRGRF